MSTDLPYPKTSEGLSAHLDGELSPEETAVVEEWLRSSNEARQTLAKLRLIEQELKSFARDARQATPALPAGWSDAVVAKISAAQVLSAETDASSPVRPAIDLDDLPLSNAPQGDAFWRRVQFWQFAGACSAAAALLFALYAPSISPEAAAPANVAFAPEPSVEEKLQSSLESLAKKSPTAVWKGEAAAGKALAAEGAESAGKEFYQADVRRKDLPPKQDDLGRAGDGVRLKKAAEVQVSGEHDAPAAMEGGALRLQGGEGRNEATAPKGADRGGQSLERRSTPEKDGATPYRAVDALRDEAGTGGPAGKGEGRGAAARDAQVERFAGAAQNGAAQNGAAQNGASQNGASQNGAAQKPVDAKRQQEKQTAGSPSPAGSPFGAAGGSSGGGGGGVVGRGLDSARKAAEAGKNGAPADADEQKRDAAPREKLYEADRAAAPSGPAGKAAPPRPAALNQLEAESVGGAAPVPGAVAAGAPAPAPRALPPPSFAPTAPAPSALPPTASAPTAAAAPTEAARVMRRGADAPQGGEFKSAGEKKPQAGLAGVAEPANREAAKEAAKSPAQRESNGAPLRAAENEKLEAGRDNAAPAKPGFAATPPAAKFAAPGAAGSAPATAPLPSAPPAGALPNRAADERAKSGADKGEERSDQKARALAAPAPAPMVARSLRTESVPGVPAPGAMALQAAPEPKLWIVSLEMSLPAVQSAALDQVLGEHKIPWQAADVAELSSDLTANVLNYQTNLSTLSSPPGRGPAPSTKSEAANLEAAKAKPAVDAKSAATPAVEAIWMEAPQAVVEEMVERMRSKPEAFPRVAVRVWRAVETQTASADGLHGRPKTQEPAGAPLPADADARLAAVSEGLRRQAVDAGRAGPPQQQLLQSNYGFAQRMRVSRELEAQLLARTEDAPLERRKRLEADETKQAAGAFGAAPPTTAVPAEGAEAAAPKADGSLSVDRSAPLRVLILVRTAAAR